MGSKSDSAALSVVLQKRKDDLTFSVASEESRNLKNSLLFQYSWPDLLQSAPTAINSMGACFIAASSDKAAVTLKRPEKGFQYLRYDSLQANLVETANLGRYAFNSAETGMGQISMAADIIDGKLKAALNCLMDPPSAKALLKPQMNAIKNSAQTCADRAHDMEKRFNDWLFYACEMHAACVEQERTNTDIMTANEISIAAEQTKLDSQKDAVAMAKSATDLLGKQVETSSEAFKKASDNFPSGWDIIGQQIVGDIASTATTALKAMIPALVSSINPVAGGMAQGQALVGSFLNKGDSNNANGTPAAKPTVKTPVDNSALRPQVDQADVALNRDMTYIELLNVIVNGPDGGVDWEKAMPSGTNPKSSIAFVADMLDNASKSFQSMNLNTPDTVKVKTILDNVSKIAAGIQRIVQDNKSISSSWPKADDAQVKAWAESFKTSYHDAQFLSASVASNQGSIPSNQVMADAEPATGDGLDAKTAQGQAILKSAQNRLDTTQKAFLSSQENYQKASASLLAQQNRLTEIQGNLKRLSATNCTLAETKKILIEAIKLIIQLKTQINNLVKFFNAFTVVISTVIQLHVEPFLASVRAIVSGDDDPNKSFVIGDFTLADQVRDNVFNSVLTLRTYFSVFGDIAKMWMRLSIENITPGLRMCDELSITSNDPQSIKAKVQKLGEWSDKASQNVNKLVGDTQAQIVEGMDGRVQKIAETTQLLPDAPAKKAIEDAKTTQTSLVDTAVKQKTENSSVNRWKVDI